jgi:SAM-dependent methyltransferase
MKVMAAAQGAHRAHRGSPFDTDAIYRGTWRLPQAAKTISTRAGGWADPGERVALKYVAVEARCRPILDMGIGTGRTTELLRAISRDYIGIDDRPELVEVCRARHPDAQVCLMDLRDLSRFDDNQFALVLFSFNGIDAVNLADRRRLLREVDRVLQPNGLFVFSAHNREAAAYDELAGIDVDTGATSAQLGRTSWQRLLLLPDSVREYVRRNVLNQLDDDRPILHRTAPHLDTFDMYATLAEQKRQLSEAGLQTELVLDNIAGRPVAEDTDTTPFGWMHFVARKV